MTINCKGQLIDLSSPKIMGILNVTPDSFYDGGRYKNEKTILLQVEKLLKDGATFIDVGAYSSRPGADEVSIELELKRILPVVELIMKHFGNSLLSIDTFRSTVAKKCIESGASLINDISAGILDNEMLPTIGKLGVPYVMMHMKGSPQTMQNHTQYEDIIKELNLYFSERIAEAQLHQIKDIIIDPGFGFSKTLEQNYEIMKNLDLLHLTDKPILVGISRKSMIYKLLNTDAKHALNGSTILNTVALLKGCNILRVHDVKQAKECITIIDQLNS